MRNLTAKEKQRIADDQFNIFEIEESGGKFEVTDTQLICRFPNDADVIAVATAATRMTVLSPDLFVVYVDVDREGDDILISLSLDDVPEIRSK